MAPGLKISGSPRLEVPRYFLLCLFLKAAPDAGCKQGGGITPGNNANHHGQCKINNGCKPFYRTENQHQDNGCKRHQRGIDGSAD